MIRADCMRALRDGMPGGGSYCSSNTPFVECPSKTTYILDVRAEFDVPD